MRATSNRNHRLYRIFPQVLTEGPSLTGIPLLRLMAMDTVLGLVDAWRSFRDSDAAFWFILSVYAIGYALIVSGWMVR